MRVLRDVLLTLLAVIIFAGVGAYAFARSGGLSARRQPGALEKALAADKCPCRSNVKGPMGVCGECKAGWEAGVGAVDGVQPQNVQQIQGDMLKMMYSMREPRERMATSKAPKPHHH